jgi:hypothetical protein
MLTRSIRIGNGAGFWGDSLDAPRLLAEHGRLDYLTLEYLAELTLSILAHQRAKNSELGYVTDLVEVVNEISPRLAGGKYLKLITNGGGMNPLGCARAVSQVLVANGSPAIRVAVVTGDDLLPRLDRLAADGVRFAHLDSGEPLGLLRDRVVSANAYLGAEGIVAALAENAQIVLTGRVADASLVVGPAVFEFGWSWDDWTRLGAATVAGHLIECGAQATGGMYSDWTPEVDLGAIGYPIVELREDGTSVIGKPAGTGGEVSVGTVSEQLVYEIGDPRRYFTPDVVADFSHVRMTQQARDEVLVEGGTGTAAPATLKVSMAYQDGFATSGMIVVAGPGAEKKARVAAEAIRSRMGAAGYHLDGFEYECLGAGDTLPGMQLWHADSCEIVLRIAGRDSRRQAIDRLARELVPLVTSGPPGVTGYTDSRSRSRPVFAHWPTTIPRGLVVPSVKVCTALEWSS